MDGLKDNSGGSGKGREEEVWDGVGQVRVVLMIYVIFWRTCSVL